MIRPATDTLKFNLPAWGHENDLKWVRESNPKVHPPMKTLSLGEASRDPKWTR